MDCLYMFSYYMATSRFDKIGPSRAAKSTKNKNGHEMVKETSPRPLATTVLREISPRFSWHRRFCELRTSKIRDFPDPHGRGLPQSGAPPEKNFSWSEPEIIKIIRCIVINGLIPYIHIYIYIYIYANEIFLEPKNCLCTLTVFAVFPLRSRLANR